MKIDARTGLHPRVEDLAEDCRSGKLSRREFLTYATSLGVAATAAYGLIGLAPAEAQTAGATPAMGGTLRIQQSVRALLDPRVSNWTEIGNHLRCMFDYMVILNNDGSISPMLLESWEANEDATEYLLTARAGVTWSNGEPFTSENLAWMMGYWADGTVEGNSMAGRFSALADPETQQLRPDAVEIVDDRTVRLRLSRPDITLIATMGDYPAAVVHPSFNPDDIVNSVCTGPYRIVEHEVGIKSAVERAESWWGTEVFGGPYLDRIEYLDYGTDPAAWVAAAESGEIDMLYETVGDFIDLFDTIGWERSTVVTGATVVIRPNQLAEVDGIRPYADVRVRRALALAVNNADVLALGYNDRGVPAENHHVAPIHPEYATLPPLRHDPEEARRLMAEAGLSDFTHELVSIDDDWRRNTTDAVAAQLRDAGFSVERAVIPGATFWNDWNAYPLSSTNWAHRPLGVQVLAIAYRSGEAWNETGYANPAFDALVNRAMAILDADARREVMVEIQTMMQEDGVVMQPYWRSLYNHARPGVVNAQVHITQQIHPHKLGLAA
jgi:peptide/nickel transport system substrate-binding protein